MTRYTITAQSYTSSQRIRRDVTAGSEAQALCQVAAVLDASGFYVLSVTAG